MILLCMEHADHTNKPLHQHNVPFSQANIWQYCMSRNCNGKVVGEIV
jgi:hypothetical protein